MKSRISWPRLGWLTLGSWLAVTSLPAATLTLEEARAAAVKTHPRLTIAQLQSLVARDVASEARAGFFPQLSANATAAAAGETITRIAAGGLSNSQIFDRFGTGLAINQLITDFGRTAALNRAANAHAKAADANVLAVRAQLLLAVDSAYYQALEAKAVKSVAERTLANRRVLFDRIDALARSQMKSDLDVRFSRVAVSEAELLVAQADGDLQSALATLANLVGRKNVPIDALNEQTGTLADLPDDAELLTEVALRQRPELDRQSRERDAARDAAKAAADSRRPNISAIGAAGVIPVHDEHFSHNYAAAAVNVNVPLFTGGLYRARQHEAELQADVADAALQALRDDIVRDVRIAWLQAEHARERMALTQSLRDNAQSARDLARTRFDQGLSSIVELNQAELALISAEIAQTTSAYEYRLRRDVVDYQTGSLK